MARWKIIETIVIVIIVSLLISSIFFPLGHISNNVTNTNKYPVYENSKVMIAPEGVFITNWSISNGNGTAIMEKFTLSKNAIVTGSWNSTIPAIVYVINYTTDKTYLKLPNNHSLYILSGSLNLHLSTGQYLLIVGTIFHGNETLTFDQPLVADYIT